MIPKGMITWLASSPVTAQKSASFLRSENSPAPMLLAVLRLNTGTAMPDPRHICAQAKGPSLRTMSAGCFLLC